MALNLYPRHRRECEAGHPEESRTGEFDERKKGWKRCACLIFASGTLDRKFRRRYTAKSDWTEAKAVAAQWEAAGSWEGEPLSRQIPPPVSDSSRVTIDRAIQAFTAEFEAHAAENTRKKYRILLRKLRAFGDSRAATSCWIRGPRSTCLRCELPGRSVRRRRPRT